MRGLKVQEQFLPPRPLTLQFVSKHCLRPQRRSVALILSQSTSCLASSVTLIKFHVPFPHLFLPLHSIQSFFMTHLVVPFACSTVSVSGLAQHFLVEAIIYCAISVAKRLQITVQHGTYYASLKYRVDR